MSLKIIVINIALVACIALAGFGLTNDTVNNAAQALNNSHVQSTQAV